jgi:hypothetical protein
MLDIILKYSPSYANNFNDVVSDGFISVVLGVFISILLYTYQSNLLLINTDESSNGESCAMAKEQTFKCSVYKNGELVSST